MDYEYKGPTPVSVGDTVSVLDMDDKWRKARVDEVFAAQFRAMWIIKRKNKDNIMRLGFFLYKDRSVSWK